MALTMDQKLTDRAQRSPKTDERLSQKRQITVALTQEGERNQLSIASASKQRVEELRAQARKQRRIKKAP